jgi:hypothetical protein
MKIMPISALLSVLLMPQSPDHDPAMPELSASSSSADGSGRTTLDLPCVLDPLGLVASAGMRTFGTSSRKGIQRHDVEEHFQLLYRKLESL